MARPTPSTSSPSVITSLVRWVRLKKYQYEVTFSLYMLTPIEKLIFNTLVLTLLSLALVAAYIYLPNHLVAIYGHIHYYLTADVSLIQDYIPSASSILRNVSGASITSNRDAIYETVKAVPASSAVRVAEL